jgi:hypothetical protein
MELSDPAGHALPRAQYLPPHPQPLSFIRHPRPGSERRRFALHLRTGKLDQRSYLRGTRHAAPSSRGGVGHRADGERRHGRVLSSQARRRAFQRSRARRLVRRNGLATAHAEIVYHRTRELAEIGVFETRVQMRLYLADFSANMHDIRALNASFDTYSRSCQLYGLARSRARTSGSGSNGILYRSVRRTGGICVACFRPKRVLNVRPDAHFEYTWEGRPAPVIRRLE